MSRTIYAPTSKIFAVLAGPSVTQISTGRKMLRSSAENRPLTAVGEVFGINMFCDPIGNGPRH